eukprot:GHVO01041567.1.p1 GENE.GHVO01041567.1~~GHVO01041567.1.p1  ORF type:complete len:254 (-),score=23.51 GHVO01041567.1:1256-2017(-)
MFVFLRLRRNNFLSLLKRLLVRITACFKSVTDLPRRVMVIYKDNAEIVAEIAAIKKDISMLKKSVQRTGPGHLTKAYDAKRVTPEGVSDETAESTEQNAGGDCHNVHPNTRTTTNHDDSVQVAAESLAVDSQPLSSDEPQHDCILQQRSPPSRASQEVVVVGSGTQHRIQGADQKTAPSSSGLFVWRLRAGTSSSDIEDHIFRETGLLLECVPLSSCNEEQNTFFRILCDADEQKRLLVADLWPEGSIVRQLF